MDLVIELLKPNLDYLEFNNIQNIPEVPDMTSKQEFISKPESSHEKVTVLTPEIPQQCGNNFGVDNQSSLNKTQKKKAREEFNKLKNASAITI